MNSARELRPIARTSDETRDNSASLDGRRSWLPVVSMLGATLVGSLLPLIRTPTFYYWDDTAGVAVGVWQRIAENVISGTPPFLQIDMWRGGNFIAEAATGMWNPVMLGLMVGTYPLDDVGIAITVAKFVLFLLTSGGVYVLARSFGATPWLAAVAGTTLALSGWALFMDGSSWINGTAITALTPWAWWALRRCYLGGFRPGGIIVAAIFAYLVPSTGNPYGVLTLAVVFLAVAVEAILARRPKALLWLAAIGAGVVLTVVVVYLPFLLTSSYGVRTASGIWNDEFLAVNLSNILGMSSPTHRPYILMFGSNPMGFPGTYLGWFVLPLLPWLRWKSLRGQWRRLSGLLVFGGVFLIFTLGPSQLGMFRWPARLIPFVYLAVIVLFVVIASRGLNRERMKLRAVLSGAIVLAGTWMAYSDVPGAWKWHALVTVLVAAGIGAVVFWSGFTSWRTFVVLAGGMVLFLVPQLALTASNQNVADYRMPSSKSEMRAQFLDRSDGLVVQVFDIQQLVAEHPYPERWEDLLAGNMPSVAGFESTTGYTGIGFNAFDNALCMSYNGGTCAAAWDELWRTPKGAEAPLADLLKAKYVVVLNDYADNRRAPAGWTEVEQTGVVTVYERDAALPYPDGTISVVGNGVDVVSDERSGATGEHATVSTGDGDDTRVTFARIAWPGYTVTVDGESVPTEIGPAGLLEVTLPAGLEAAELKVSFTPPGLLISGIAAAVGLVVIVVTAMISTRRPRLDAGDASARTGVVSRGRRAGDSSET